MGESDSSYGLLSQTSDIHETRDPRLNRHLPLYASFHWLADGWRDFWKYPASSLAYGLGVFILSVAFIWTLVSFGRDYILFPALAGFLIVAPFLAIGLYEKSRRLEAGKSVSLAQMIMVRPKGGEQVFYTGLMLCMLMLLWMRAAVIVYGLFFGVTPFPGLNHITEMLFYTPNGWAMLIVGTLIGGLFAAFSFAISVFAVPMLVEHRYDALTAMGTSMRLVWNNLPPLLVWGAVVMGLIGLCLITGLIGMIIIFPLLGHATWHAYRAVALPDD